ncbi:hypothetical protein A0H81_00178 [Grifola frondosa]|uniref:Peptidase A1 domain-containing protein n=1 Tax=Grifola frondosa TaxID=5627 RepID=A0A1C7MQX9_GRIFR|nr:hypothetical protein A0H81_00178 [Grifola frondosa]
MIVIIVISSSRDISTCRLRASPMPSSTMTRLLTLCFVYAAPAVYAFTPPATVNIPLLFDSSGRYNAAASSTARNLTSQDGVSILGSSINGSVIKEDCTMATSNGSSWPYPNQTIVVANDQGIGTLFGNGVSGMVGLGTNKNIQTPSSGSYSAGFNDTIFGGWLNRNPGATNFSYGMDIHPPAIIPSASSSGLASNVNLGSGGGTLHWLQPDNSAYVNDQVVWRSVESSAASSSDSQQADWQVMLDGWSAKIGSSSAGNSASMLTNVDPFYPDIYMPLSQAQQIHDAITGAVLQSSLSTIPGQSQAWTVPCNTQISFTVNIGSQSFTVDQSILVVPQSDGTCVSVIEAWTSTNNTQYILGARFISQLYLVFNIPRDGTDQIGFAPRTQSKSRDIGAIVGGTVGGVAGVVALGLLAFYLIRRRQDNSFFKRAAYFEEEAKVARTVEPYVVGQGPPTPAQASHLAFGSPPMSPSAPLLGQLDTGAAVAPPSYEEASESGARSPTLPRDSKSGYLRRQTLMSTAGSPSATPNDTSEFSGSSAI